jgi:hypothetical protein
MSYLFYIVNYQLSHHTDTGKGGILSYAALEIDKRIILDFFKGIIFGCKGLIFYLFSKYLKEKLKN